MKIIYNNIDNSISIITPTEEALSFATIKQIAEKDVPSGLSYWIVEDEVIPEDRTFRKAWQVDESIGEAYGTGAESSEFSAEILAKLGV